MALTLGSGPFGKQSTGKFNFEVTAPRGHTLYLKDSPKRIRAIFNGETVVDSRRVKLLHETNHLPVYYFPEEDIREDLLEPTDHHTHCPFKGDASYRSLKLDGREIENAVWHYPEPLEQAPWLDGYAALYWEKADLWLQEDEPVRGHLRDPYHRVDVYESSRRVKVKAGGTVIAETDRPKLVFETSLPPRPYLLRSDVLPGILEQSQTTSSCPYKGEATWWNVRTGDGVIEDAAWSYETPLPEAAKAVSHLSFDGDGIETEVS